jgi:ubiquinone/menaquinone biosynthesis C-methylase UbiE
MIDEQTRHPMLPTQTHDELARENFARSFKKVVFNHLTPGVRDIWEHRVGPEFEAKEGRPPADRHEIRKVMMNDSYVKMWCSLRRVSQELLWDAVSENVERQRDDLIEKAKKMEGEGTLKLDPSVEVPRYISAVDIHLMPTGYWQDTCEDDVASGALFDRGVYVYASGQLGQLNDGYGNTIVDNFLKVEYPDLQPKRILDVGCTAGGSMLKFIDTYPDAEVHGIDVGAPVLRYGHARMKGLGRVGHFHQMNGEATTFPDGHFDIVYSTILMHETARTALRNIFAESYRTLAPGGIMIHAEFPQYEGLDAFTQFMLDWDTYNNNEPFWGAMHDTDLEALANSVGFDRSNVRTVYVPALRQLQNGAKAGGGMKLALTVAVK